MGVTPVDLYRNGNASSARLDHVRPADVDTYIGPGGGIWVKANGKGVSSWDTPDEDWSGKLWRLHRGHSYSNLLLVWNDDPGHWVWMPNQDMPLSAFRNELSLSNRHFVKMTTS
jgi:hypothetical protein